MDKENPTIEKREGEITIQNPKKKEKGEYFTNTKPPKVTLVPEKLTMINKERNIHKNIFFGQLIAIFMLITMIKVYPYHSPIYIISIIILFITIYYMLYYGKGLSYILHEKLQTTKAKIKSIRKPKRIILIRHGESAGNLDSKIYSSIPDSRVPLTEKGKQQAKEAGEKLRKIIGEETVRFFVSPYKRSVQTFKEILKGMNLPSDKFTAREDPRLREQDFGNLQEPGSIDRIQDLRRYFGSFFFRFNNGESGADCYDRVTSFLGTLKRESQYEKSLDNYILVTHGLTARLFLMRYFKWTVDEFHRLYNLTNCQIIILEKEESNNFKYKLITPLKRNTKVEQKEIFQKLYDKLSCFQSNITPTGYDKNCK